MMKRMIAILMAVCCGITLAAAENTAAGPIRSAEVRTVIRELTEQTRDAGMLSEPGEENGLHIFTYGFATFYSEEGELTPDSAVSEVTLMDEDLTALRGTGINMSVTELIAAMPGTNPELAGTFTDALLYLDGTEYDFRFGRVQRNGQRISAVEYGEIVSSAEGIASAGAVYNISGDGVASVQLYDLNEKDADGNVGEFFRELEALREETGYTRVPVSFDGLSLTPFGEEDLCFSGIDYLNAVPEDLLVSGNWEDGLVDNEDGSFLRIMNGENGLQLIFRCDSAGQNAELLSVSILSEDVEGPRHVRLGDSFSDDFNRFRNGEGASDENGEILYGTEGVAPWGAFLYNDGDGMTLRYVTDTGRGVHVELYLHYTETVLTEIILHTV